MKNKENGYPSIDKPWLKWYSEETQKAEIELLFHWRNNDIKNDLLRMLHSQLPDHFIPKDIVILDKMPITQNGKIDYRELTRKYNLI